MFPLCCMMGMTLICRFLGRSNLYGWKYDFNYLYGEASLLYFYYRGYFTYLNYLYVIAKWN